MRTFGVNDDGDPNCCFIAFGMTIVVGEKVDENRMMCLLRKVNDHLK